MELTRSPGSSSSLTFDYGHLEHHQSRAILAMANSGLSLSSIFSIVATKPSSPLFSPSIYSSSSSYSPSSSLCSKSSSRRTKTVARLGGGDGDLKRPAKKKFITREEEPEQYLPPSFNVSSWIFFVWMNFAQWKNKIDFLLAFWCM